MIERFEKTPGNDVLRSIEDPGMLLIGCDKPADVKLPNELGGTIHQCLNVTEGRCPAHPEHLVKKYVLEGTTVVVFECDQFYWCREG